MDSETEGDQAQKKPPRAGSKGDKLVSSSRHEGLKSSKSHSRLEKAFEAPGSPFSLDNVFASGFSPPFPFSKIG